MAVYLEDGWGEPVVELESDGYYYKVPDDFTFDYLAVGDVYTVVEVEDGFQG